VDRAAQPYEFSFSPNGPLGKWSLQMVQLSKANGPSIDKVAIINLILTKQPRMGCCRCHEGGSSIGGGAWRSNVGVGCSVVEYFVNKNHNWYSALFQTFLLVQGTYTPQVNRHARHTKSLQRTVRCGARR